MFTYVLFGHIKLPKLHYCIAIIITIIIASTSAIFISALSTEQSELKMFKNEKKICLMHISHSFSVIIITNGDGIFLYIYELLLCTIILCSVEQ